MNPFERIAKRYKTLPKVNLAQGQSIAYSRSITRRLMELIDANAHGNVHGGVIGDVVSVHCEMSYVGRTSMEVGVEVMAEDVITGEVRHIASSYVIYVALDENRKPTPVPPLLPANDEEKTIIERARIRRMHWQKIDEELKRAEEVKD